MSSEPFSVVSRWRRRLRPEEALLILFTLALVALAVIFRRAAHFNCPTAFGFAGLAVVGTLMVCVSEGRLSSGWRAARDFAPFVGCVLIYESLGGFLRYLPLVDRTEWALRMDALLFGTLPCYWFESLICGPMNVLMLVCYSMHYVMAPLLAVVFYRAGREVVFRNFMLAVIGAMYVGYIGYMLVPVNPPSALQKLPLADQLRADNPAVRALLYAYTTGDLRTIYDCFPSLHTAVTIITLVFAWRFARRCFWLLAPFGSGLIVATQYARIHFVIDLIAGAAMAAVMIWAAPRVNAWWFGDLRYREPR